MNRDDIWGIDREQFLVSLRSGDTDLIDSLDFNRLSRWGKLDHISGVREGGAYYFSFVMESLGEVSWQVRFLEEELNSGLYAGAAAEELYTLLSSRNEWSELARLLEKADLSVLNEGDADEYLKEALYRSGQLKKLLRLYDGDALSIYEMKALIETSKSLPLEETASFVYNRASVQEAYEIWQLLDDMNLTEALPHNLRHYLLICSSYSGSRETDLNSALNQFSISKEMAERYPSLIYRMRLPVQQAEEEKLWADRFSSLETFEASFTAGRLYRSNKSYALADEYFRYAFDLAATSFERDRAQWYLMSLYRSNTAYLTGLIEESAPHWSDPSYFNDILEEYLSQIAAEGRWDLLEKVYPLIGEYGDREIVAAFSWVRYISPKAKQLSPDEKQEMLLKMRESSHFSFYHLMGSLLAGRELEFDSYEQKEMALSDADRFILGFYDFSLDELALDKSRGLEGQLSDFLLRKLSNQAREAGDYLRSIQIANYISPGEGRYYSREDLLLKYPLAYGEYIDLYSSEYSFPSEILKGIIRTESAFSREIVSYAGAVGLSQLMPETAAEQARKLGIDNPDLTDPETNVRIGSSYVRWILDRPWNDNLSQMLIAYNGGGGNLRKWKRMYPRYRDELFVEALPYKETRNYVKKVLTSSVVYGAVYEGINPEDIVRKIYPDFLSLREIHR